MNRRILNCLQLDKKYLLEEIAEEEEFIKNLAKTEEMLEKLAEERALINSIIANKEPTSEETKEPNTEIKCRKERTKELNAKIKKRIDYLKSKLEATEAQLKAFDEKLHAIEDPELKEMAIAYYIEWKSCEEIGKKFFLERTTVYKKLMSYFSD